MFRYIGFCFLVSSVLPTAWIIFKWTLFYHQSWGSGSGSGSDGSVINWLPGFRSVILNYRFGFLLFIKDSMIFNEKGQYFIIFNDLLPVPIWQHIFFNRHKSIPVRSGSGSIFGWPPGSLIQDYESANPDPKEIFADPQHCLPPTLSIYDCIRQYLSFIVSSRGTVSRVSWPSAPEGQSHDPPL
jgi:hypothetical protein